MRRLARAFPRYGIGHNHSHGPWQTPPEELWKDILRFERNYRMARMTLEQTEDAILRVIAGGPWEFWTLNRIDWAFTATGCFRSRWGIHEFEGDPKALAAELFRKDEEYLRQLAAPDMTEAALTDLAVRIRAECESEVEGEEDLGAILSIQLPNAGAYEMLIMTRKTRDPAAVIAEALARTRPDPNVVIYSD